MDRTIQHRSDQDGRRPASERVGVAATVRLSNIRMVLRRAFVTVVLFAVIPVGAQTPGVLPPPPEGVEIREGVPFLEPGRKELLDLYLPKGRAPGTRSPAVVIIHGGGWTGGKRNADREFNIGTTLAKAGYVAASLDYRLEAAGRWPTNLHDCKNGVRFLRVKAAELGVDPEKIGVIGGSAGGHLALMVALTQGLTELEPTRPYPNVSSRVGAAVNLYGVVNLRSRKKTDAAGNPTEPAGPALSLFGDVAHVTDADLDLGSPITHLRKNSPPLLTLHGMADTTVDRDQAHELDQRAKSVGARHEMKLLPGVGHTFTLQTWNRNPLPEDLRPLVVGFFDRHLHVAR